MSQDDITRAATGFWDAISRQAGTASAIDPNDRLGFKNAYIAQVRDHALSMTLGRLAPASTVVDFGCGTGTFLGNLRRSHPALAGFGLDISREMLRLASATQAELRGRIMLFDGSRLPLRPESVDAITTGGVLLYLTSEISFKVVCGEFRRVLKPGGLVACVEQVRRRDRHDPANCKLQRAPKSMIEGFHGAGLELVEWRQVRRGRFPLIYLIRYGLLPRRWFGGIARLESTLWRQLPAPAMDYADALFVFRKPSS
jgi:SAM-dependent methyltransferase